MQAVRTIVWVLVLVALLAFSFLNWRPVEVTIWPNLILETKVPALVVIAFLMGLIPTWLVHRGVKWQMQRRISSLESAARANAMPPPPAAPPVIADPPAPPPPVEPTPLDPEAQSKL
jgi:lipopolysaccharide assembly protein A